MTDHENPYSAPEAALAKGPIANAAETRDGITQRTRDYVAKASPWATFLGVLGFVLTGFIVLVSLGIILFAGLLTDLFGDSIPILGSLGEAGRIGGVFIGILYLLMSLLAFFPSLRLVNAGAASKRYRLRGDPADLERFMLEVRRLAKFFGIVAIVAIGFYAVIIIVALAGAA